MLSPRTAGSNFKNMIPSCLQPTICLPFSDSPGLGTAPSRPSHPESAYIWVLVHLHSQEEVSRGLFPALFFCLPFSDSPGPGTARGEGGETLFQWTKQSRVCLHHGASLASTHGKRRFIGVLNLLAPSRREPWTGNHQERERSHCHPLEEGMGR